jgi:hypothetical protein
MANNRGEEGKKVFIGGDVLEEKRIYGYVRSPVCFWFEVVPFFCESHRS